MGNLVPTLKYALITAKHKYFVFRAGLRTKTPVWQLIIHDLSKFGPSELPHYGRQFFGDKGSLVGQQKFAEAWLHHQNVNPHHWEYWIPRTGHNKSDLAAGENLPMPMPFKYAQEMVADWLGAGRAYEGHYPKSEETWTWWQNNCGRIKLHPATSRHVHSIIHQYFKNPL